MDRDVLMECALEFKKIADYNYLFTVGKSKKVMNISLSCASKDFTHIVGLDHLSDIQDFSTNRSSVKLSAFNNIINGKLTLNEVSQSAFFAKPYRGTYNNRTKSEYTPIERITALKNISGILDVAYKGELYKWDCSKLLITLPNGKIKRSSIMADYMLAIPSPTDTTEKIYLFMYEGKPYDNNTKQLYVFSAFPDCLDLSKGQERPYTILTEGKENIRTKEMTHLFTYPNYSQTQDTHLTQKGDQSNNINQFTNISPTIAGGAVALAPARPSFRQAVASLWGKFMEYLDDKCTENKRTIEQLHKFLEKRTKQLSERNEEIAALKKENAELNSEIEKLGTEIKALKTEKTPVKTAAQTKSFLQGLDEFAERQRAQNAKKNTIQPNKKPPRHGR